MKEFLYRSLKKYCTVVLYFYFKKWQIRNVVPIIDSPVIFVANHQNAFLDAVIIGCATKRNPWFLTRANVFQKEFVKKIFNTFKMTPVYRFRDGFSTLRKNDEVIDRCVQLLAKGEAIVIFGEGNHDEHWRLRPLQKGFARIAITAEEKNMWSLGVKIIPVGLQYDSHSAFRSRMLITFGKPISVKEIAQTRSSLPEQQDALVEITSEAIRPLMLHIDQPDYEKKREYLLSNRVIKKDLEDQLQSDQEIIAHAPVLSEGMSVTNKFRERKPWWNPIFLYSSINLVLPQLLINWFLKSKVKDPQFTGSLKFALGMVLVPLFYLLQTALCLAISDSWLVSGAYFFSLPLSVWLRD